MTEESLTPPVVPKSFRTREQRRRQAEYSARHRERHAGEPDMRLVDRAVVEALGLYLQSLPPEQTAVLAPALTAAAISGLEYAGYGRRESRRAVGTRLRHFTSSTSQGIVRAARYRSSEGSGDLTS